jgi:hypothetical protein
VPRRGTPRKKWPALLGYRQGAAGASRLGVGSKKRPSRQWAVNEGARGPVIFRPFLGPGAYGKPPYHRPQVDLDALPNRGGAIPWVVDQLDVRCKEDPDIVLGRPPLLPLPPLLLLLLLLLLLIHTSDPLLRHYNGHNLGSSGRFSVFFCATWVMERIRKSHTRIHWLLGTKYGMNRAHSHLLHLE